MQQPNDRTRTLTCADGARIGLRVAGDGPPAVIVPGSLAPTSAYNPLFDALARRHRVHLVTRRGYEDGEAGPRPCQTSYQAEDLAGVFARLQEPATVFGHSLGGIIALCALDAVPGAVDRLVLYEPPVALLGERVAALRDECAALLDAGQPEEAVRRSFEISGSPELVSGGEAGRKEAALRLVPLARGLVMDLECAAGMTVDDIPTDRGRWPTPDLPVLLLGAGLSGPLYAEGVRMLRERIADVEYKKLTREPHFPTDLNAIARLVAASDSG
ncbi:MAG: alpha/beta fold hydrolase [Actinocrinis sp.]